MELLRYIFKLVKWFEGMFNPNLLNILWLSISFSPFSNFTFDVLALISFNHAGVAIAPYIRNLLFINTLYIQEFLSIFQYFIFNCLINRMNIFSVICIHMPISTPRGVSVINFLSGIGAGGVTMGRRPGFWQWECPRICRRCTWGSSDRGLERRPSGRGTGTGEAWQRQV